MAIHELLARFGLPAVFLGAALEGDVSMVLAGVAAHFGELDPGSTLVAGALGAYFSDLAWFTGGRLRADAIRENRFYRHAAPYLEPLARRVGPWQIPLARFLYGTRLATLLYWGARGLAWWRFAMIDAFGSLLWAAVIGGLGYLASSSAEVILGRVRRLEIALLGSLVGVGVIVLAGRYILRRRRRAAAKIGPPGSPPHEAPPVG